jgi:hypothetical protein
MNEKKIFMEAVGNFGLTVRQYESISRLYDVCFEATMKDLSGPVDNLRKYRSKALMFHYNDLTRNPKTGHAVVHFVVPSASNEKNYDVYIEFIPKDGTLFSMAQGPMTPAKKIGLLRSCDVKVFCTCPDFNWSGMKYNLKHIYDSYLSGYESIEGVPPGGEDIPPNVKDPHHKNRVCKHLLAAFNAVMTNWMTIIKAAKNYRITDEPPVNEEPVEETPIEQAPTEAPAATPEVDENISPDENGI